MPDDAGAEVLRLDIGDDKDVVRVRQAVRVAAVEAKLPLVDQTKLVTAASELARNTLIHGGGGYATIAGVHNGRRAGVRAEFVDSGPGIVDLGLAFTDGYTTGSGLGLGLSGSRRLVDEFEIDTTPGAGTRIAVTKWAR
ncbi:ATP-binding protein [Dactylosporangium matsuzakiense]|uniref:Anti-sigma regulatory factor n=1 Tax=Dactylosporangium matsuzakiense TaxID=53360 RepID=A0A9W6KXH6_9ACTN|nr:ATP-binding protein [Dactylosporangium matsuzakiense]UWZ49044.1 anti-sigma regulatory factor [Dactylosporangium matsuzakiense]GLL08210.1 anti-sigma regulatory factor [Dactylosporangium matsuzakiense]